MEIKKRKVSERRDLKQGMVRGLGLIYMETQKTGFRKNRKEEWSLITHIHKNPNCTLHVKIKIEI